jgi:vacuolar-type H+-ATPase subunit E/Vma4
MSKVDEKLARFSNDIMTDLGEERNMILNEVEERERQAFETKELALLTQAYEKIQSALLKIDKEKNELMSKTLVDNRTRLLHKRLELIDEIFNEAVLRLQAFAKSEAYMPHLLGLIEEGRHILGVGNLEVYLNYSDHLIKEQVSATTGLKVVLESKQVNLVGGCKIYNRTSQKVVDYSFANDLEDLREDFLHKCNLEVG